MIQPKVCYTIKEAIESPANYVSVCAYALFGTPRRTAGADHTLAVYLSDATANGDTHSGPLICMVFGPPDMLEHLIPENLDRDAVVFIHCGKRQIFQGNPQLVIRLRPQKRGWQDPVEMASFFNQDAADLVPGAAAALGRPYATTNTACAQAQVDLVRVRNMWQWATIWKQRKTAAAAAATPAPSAAPGPAMPAAPVAAAVQGGGAAQAPPSAPQGPAATVAALEPAALTDSVAAAAPVAEGMSAPAAVPAVAVTTPAVGAPAAVEHPSIPEGRRVPDAAASHAPAPAVVAAAPTGAPGPAHPAPGAAMVPAASAVPPAQVFALPTPVGRIRDMVTRGLEGYRLLAPAVDIVCKVLAVDFCHCPDYYVVHVWDGTDATPLPFGYNHHPSPQPQAQERQAQGQAQAQAQAQSRPPGCQPHSHLQPCAGAGTAAGANGSAAGGPNAGEPPLKQPRIEPMAGPGTSAEPSAGFTRVEASTEPSGAASMALGFPANKIAGAPACNRNHDDWVYESELNEDDQEEDEDDDGPYCPPPPHQCRLYMPLRSVAQWGADEQEGQREDREGDEEAGNQAAARCEGGRPGRSGWEVLSAVVGKEDMPVAGSHLPLVLPAPLLASLAPAGTRSQPGRPASTRGRGGSWARCGGGSGAPGRDGRAPGRQGPAGRHRTGHRLPHLGEWVQLRRVGLRVVAGQLQLSFTARSALEPCPPARRAALEQAYAERLALHGGAGLHSWAPRDPSQLIARVCRPWQALPLRTLRQLLMQQATCDLTPVRVMVRVVAITHPDLRPPTNVEPLRPPGPTGVAEADPAAAAKWVAELEALKDAVFPAALLRSDGEVPPGGVLDRAGNGQSFAMSFHLEDSTASVRAILFGGAGNLFFWYTPATTPEPHQPQLRHDPAGQPGPVRGGPLPPSPSQSTGGVRTRGQATHESRQEQDHLLAALHALTDPAPLGGTWMEAILRPMYHDPHNPCQSAVYGLEHTVMRSMQPPQKRTTKQPQRQSQRQSQKMQVQPL